MAVDRLTLRDAINLAADGGSAPTNIGVLLVLSRLQSAADNDDAALVALVGERLASVPRFRQVLLPAPFGCGARYWADAPTFDVARHVGVKAIGAGEAALLGAASELVTTRLPWHRPLWRVRLLVQPDGERALLAVLHHVVADGMSGFAMLSGVDDDAWSDKTDLPPPRALPTRSELAVDAWQRRLAGLRGSRRAARAIAAGVRELGLARGGDRPGVAPASSINQPTGAVRRVAVVDLPLAPLLTAARARRATLNDLLVAATAGALATLMRRRGEQPERLVVSVPVAATAPTAGGGNNVGVLPVAVPTTASMDVRIDAVARATAARRGRDRGSSADLVAVMSRGLAAVGLLQPFLERQRLVSTIESNLRGPMQPLTIAGQRVERLVPVGFSPGNLGVTFLVCSYAGRLGVTVCADPAIVPEYREVAAFVREELEQVLG